MMDSIAQLWSQVPGWGLAAVALVVVWGGARMLRTRKPDVPRPTLMPPMAPDDPAGLDSSHVGGPLFDSPAADPYAHQAGPITKGGAS